MSESADVPRLRADLVVEPLEDGRIAVFDSAFQSRIKLDAKSAAIVNALDVRQSLGALAARVGSDPDDLGGLLGSLERYHLLDRPEAHAAAAAARSAREHAVESPSSVPLKIRDDARFSCTQCGSCCGGHSIGPVKADTIKRLTPMLDELARKTRAEGDLFFEMPSDLSPEESEGPTYGCSVRGGSCVFLSGEGKCVIHADYGGTMKPRVCRVFPYEFVATPDGVEVSISQKCRDFAEAGKGEAIRDDEASIRELLSLLPHRPTVPTRLRLDADQSLSWPQYQELEAELHERIDASEDMPGVWLGMRAVLTGWTEREPGPGGSLEELGSELVGLCRQVAEFAGEKAPKLAGESSQHIVLSDSLAIVGSAVGELPGRWRTAAQPMQRESSHKLVVSSLHHDLMGKALLMRAPTVTQAFSRRVFGWFVGRSIMLQRAAEAKRRHLVDQDVMDAIVTIRSVFDDPAFESATESLSPQIESLFFDRLDELLTFADKLIPQDPRHQIYRT